MQREFVAVRRSTRPVFIGIAAMVGVSDHNWIGHRGIDFGRVGGADHGDIEGAGFEQRTFPDTGLGADRLGATGQTLIKIVREE